MKKALLSLFFIVPLFTFAQVYGDKYPSFVAQDSCPNLKSVLPAPPDTASLNYFNDYLQYMWGKSVRNTERGQQAIRDAELEDFQVTLDQFADAFGYRITKEETPELYNLLFWAKNDASNATYIIKKTTAKRKRPYVQFNECTLIPEGDEDHRNSSSFPSNHSAAGWGIALIMVELCPENTVAIIQRGFEYGQSRVIAGYHYQSDVDNGRFAAAMSIARIHAEPFFQKQLAKAKKELAKLKKAK